MTTFDVHTDKALKELRARLDQAERERDEARAEARSYEERLYACAADVATLVGERDEARAALASRDAARLAYASEFVPGADGEPDVGSIHENIRKLKSTLAGEPARIAAAEMARDVAWVRAACCAAPGPRSFLRTGLVTTKTDDIIEAVCSGATDADIAAAIRAARGVR